MKKSLAIVLALVFVLSIAGTALAAPANPFVDVPAKHWAYDAVSSLAKAGIVDGYGDGTFRGDRTMTRYEMAQIVAKAMAKSDKADAANKALIDKLAVEFAAELNNLGVRVAKVEAKQNTWVGGETRVRYVGDSPSTELIASGAAKLHHSQNYDFRQRIKFWGTVNDDVSWMGRLTASGNPGNTASSPGNSAVYMDIFNVTVKNFLGLDQVRVGRSALDFYTHGLMGKPHGQDGIRVIESFGPTQFMAWHGQNRADANSGAVVPDNSSATTAQVKWNISKDTNILTGYYWADSKGSAATMNVTNGASFEKSKGFTFGFDTMIGGLTLMGDYAATKLAGASANLPSSPKAWFVQLSNAPAMHPKVTYQSVGIVNPSKPGTDAWMVAYRSIDAGALPNQMGGWDTVSVANAGTSINTFTKASDNVKALFLAYQSVLAKNVVMSLEFQDIKLKNKDLTSFTSDGLNKTYKMTFEFYY